MKRFSAALLALVFTLLLCPVLGEQTYADGIYRGSYYDGGIEQIAIQFELKDGLFVSIVYRGVKYKDGDYMAENASDAQKATLRQYTQLADYLVGKGVEAIDDLYTPYDIVEDVDAVTTATIQSSKLISALWDGLNRHPYRLVDTSKLPEAEPYDDGTYRGSYMESGVEEVAVEFTIADNIFTDIRYRALQYKGADYLAPDAPQQTAQIRAQFQELIDYLVGKPVASVNDLYRPGDIATDTDATSAATLRSPKVISSIWDALNRHAYRID